MLPVQECSKRAKNSPIFSKNAKFTLTLMSKEKLNFLLQIQILHFKYVWNLPSLSLARFGCRKMDFDELYFLQATQAVKIKFKIVQKWSLLKFIFQKSGADQQGSYFCNNIFCLLMSQPYFWLFENAQLLFSLVKYVCLTLHVANSCYSVFVT